MSDLIEDDDGKLRLSSGAFYDAVDRRPWHEKMWQRLGFHNAHASRPDHSEHWIITGIHVRLSRLDRLRVLLSGRLHVEVCVSTEHDAGRTVSQSSAAVTRPRRGPP
jgi:hypothetical protein